MGDNIEVKDDTELDELETELDNQEEEYEEQESEEESETDESESDGTEDDEDSEEDDDSEVFVTIGDEEVTPDQEEDDKSAPSWVKEVRENNKNLSRENRELKKQLEQLQTKREDVKEVSLPPKPKLEDVDYDSEVYEQKLDQWYEQKKEYDKVQSEKQKAEEEALGEWKKKLESYTDGKKKLNVRDYDDAEFVVQETLSEQQQAMILQGADDPNILVYALGKNPAKVKEIASINDPVKFAFAVAKLEKDLKVTKRKPPTKPEKKVSGAGIKSGTVDKTEERLREKAEKSGNYSELIAYRKKKQNNKG